MTTPLLDIEGRVVDRQRELAELRSAVARAERSGGECVLLSGAPGVGKSTLVQAFGDDVSVRNCVFAYGRCRDGAPTPYAAIGDALASLVHTMEATSPAERDRWRADLVNTSSALVSVLAELVPALTDALGEATPPADVDATEARHRLHRATIQLLSVTAAYRMVVFAIDDLQWADRDSVLLLSELLAAAPRNVLVVGAHRSDEFDAGTAGFACTDLRAVDIKPLRRESIEELLGDVVGRGAELDDVATEFHRRTGGNPLQIRQLLYRAQRDGALVPVAGSGPPAWNLRVLSAMEVSETEADFLGLYLDQLRRGDRAILGSLACVGSEFDLADAAAACGETVEVVAPALWSSMELRLLDALDSRGQRIANAIGNDLRYRFSHDRVAEAARTGLPECERRQTHLRLGRRLVQLGDARLFEAARLVGDGGLGLEEDTAERVAFAEVSKRAARKAKAQASYPLALAYCRNGLALLGTNRWTVHFDQTRELHLDAADAALLVSEYPLLLDLLDEAFEHLLEPADRARLQFLRVKCLFAQDRPQEAMAAGLRALAEFGEPMPVEPGKPRMANAVLRLRLTMSRWSNARLLDLPQCADRLVIEKQRLLVALCHESYNVRPNLFPVFVRKQLELTVAHGHTPSSPRVLANCGLLLVILGDHAGAQRFGEAGMTLAERPEYRDTRAFTMFVYFGFIRHWRHSVRSGLSALRDAVEAALDQGDQETAGFLASTFISQMFWVGRPCGDIDVIVQSIIPNLRSVPTPYRLCQAMQQMALNLSGRSEDPYLLAGESGFDEREVLPAARREGQEVILSVAATMKQGLYFWSGDHAGAVAATDDAVAHIGGLTGTAVAPVVYLIGALSLMQQAPRERATARFVRDTLAMYRKCAESAPENYDAGYALVQGAWARVRGHHDKAEQHLHRAIQLAEENQLPMICARAYEEAAAVYSDTRRSTFRNHMLQSAYQRWLSLGVTVRTDWLAREHPWLLRRDIVHPGATGIDSADAHQLLRTLSNARTEKDLDGVILSSAAQATGASRVLLLIGSGEEAWIRAAYDHGEVSITDGRWTEVPFDRAAVRLAVAEGTPRASVTREEKRVLCVPIRLHDKTIGVIYAEHDAAGNTFTPDHEEALAFLCGQAAAPISNFQLEAQLKAADQDRQSLIDAQARFVPNELLRILDFGDLSRVRTGHTVEREMTVLISDIRGYTTILEDMQVADASNLAMGFLRAVELPIVSCNGLVQDVRGDEVLAIFDSAADAVRAGLAMLRSLREHNRQRTAAGSEELRAGIGINTGTIGVGLVGGVNRMAVTVIGDAVNLAARIESTNKRYGSALLISDATRSLLTGPQQFDVRRMERVMVVNRRRPVTIFEVFDEDPQELREAKRAAAAEFDEAFQLFDAGNVSDAEAAFGRCLILLPGDTVAPLHLSHCEAIARGEMTPGQDVVLRQK